MFDCSLKTDWCGAGSAAGHWRMALRPFSNRSSATRVSPRAATPFSRVKSAAIRNRNCPGPAKASLCQVTITTMESPAGNDCLFWPTVLIDYQRVRNIGWSMKNPPVKCRWWYPASAREMRANTPAPLSTNSARLFARFTSNPKVKPPTQIFVWYRNVSKRFGFRSARWKTRRAIRRTAANAAAAQQQQQ